MLLGDFVRGWGDFILLANAASLGDLGDLGETLPCITNLSLFSFKVLVSVSFSENNENWYINHIPIVSCIS